MGARSGARTLTGCGSKVKTTEGSANFLESAHRSGDKRLMTEMDAVEIAESDDGTSEILTYFTDMAYDLHRSPTAPALLPTTNPTRARNTNEENYVRLRNRSKRRLRLQGFQSLPRCRRFGRLRVLFNQLL